MSLLQFFRSSPFAPARLPRINVLRYFSIPAAAVPETSDNTKFRATKQVKSNTDNFLKRSNRIEADRQLEYKLRSFVKPEYSICWTSEMDERLLVINLCRTEKKFKVSWAWVAEQMCGGVTAIQCQRRWNTYVKHIHQKGIKQGEWSDEELLEKLVPQHVSKPYWSERRKVMTQERINWTAIGKLLNRIPVECKTKWRDLQASKLKQGPFTAEEDALIRQRVLEWGDKGNGLWLSMEKALKRPKHIIRARWESVLSTDRYYVEDKGQKEKPLLRKKAPSLQWTPELDAKLTKAVGLYKESGGWARVAEHMGGGITWQQCQDRWFKYLQYMQQEDIKQGDWSDKEIHFLEELVAQHEKESSLGAKWTTIGKQLNRIPGLCQGKWNNLQARKMKKGPFTAEEDALIRKRALEWGDKGNGLWVSLAKEMGRSADDIRIRWRGVAGHVSNAKDEVNEPQI